MFVGWKMKNIIKTMSSLLYSVSTRETIIIKSRISYCRENNEMKKIVGIHLTLHYKYTYNKLSVADRQTVKLRLLIFVLILYLYYIIQPPLHAFNIYARRKTYGRHCV